MNLAPLPIQKFFNNNGRPLEGGKLFTYVSGTTTKIATYTDSSGGALNTNPVILDFRGECRLWIDPTKAYTFVLAPSTDTDPPTNPFWTVNDITAAPFAFDNAAVDTGSVNNIALSIPQISSPVAFTRIVFKAANTNTSAVTISINGGTAKALTWQNIGALAGGEIQAGGIYEAVFDGAQWQLQGPALLPDQMRTAAEVAASVTPVVWPTFSGKPVYDLTRMGVSTTASAATNSTAIQNASEVAWRRGGAVLYLPAGTYDIDTPPRIFETVSIVGDGKNSSILHKSTATASTVSDPTVPFYGGGAVGFPVCNLHFVGHNGTDNWSYGECRDIGCTANTTSPNTTSTVYGFFFRGVIGGRVIGCQAGFQQVGFFWGSGSTITSVISGNLAGNVQRGFYQHFMTSTFYVSNYAIGFRFAGHFLSWYYSNVIGNAADNAGAPWKVGTTEISLAYQGNACRGGMFSGNGCETHNGSVFNFSNCISVSFVSNLALDISSNYTGGSDICLWENNGNNSCVYTDNRMQTSGMTGTGARHFIYKITTELGNYVWQRNRFVANISDNTDTSTWANISGTIVETQATFLNFTTFTPTIAGSGTAGTPTYTTQSGSYSRQGQVSGSQLVNFRLRVSWSALAGAVGNLVVGGLPFAAANTDDVPVNVVADSLTFAGQLAGMINKNTTTISLYSQATGAAVAGVAIDTAATVWISGSYLT